MAIQTYRQFAGIKNTVPEHELESTDLSRAVNVDIHDGGYASRRGGHVLRVVGSSHSLWASGGTCLYMAESALRRLKSDLTSELLLSGLSGERMRYADCNGRIFMSDGRAALRFDHDVVGQWGIIPPPRQPAASPAVSNGALPKGLYHVAVVYRRRDGEESGTGKAVSVDLPAHGGITLTGIPVSSDPEVTGKNVYITRPNGKRLRLLTTIPNASTSFAITASPLELSVALRTQFKQNPPPCRHMAQHNGRMLIAVGSHVLFSDAYLPERFDPLRQSYAFMGNITLLAPFQDGVFVGTASAIYRLAGEDIAAASLVTVADYGVIEDTLAYMDRTVLGDGSVGGRIGMVTTTQGICVVGDEGLFTNLTRIRFTMPNDGAIAAAAGVALTPGNGRYLLSSTGNTP